MARLLSKITAVSAAVAAAALMPTTVAHASSGATVETADTATAAACVDWFDTAGYGGAERFHVQCAGYNITITYDCNNSSMKTVSGRDYKKAECPYGGYFTYVDYVARR